MTFTVLSSEWLGFCYNLIPFQSYVMFFSFFLHANYRIWLGTFWPSHEMWVGLLLVHYILRLLLGTFLLNIVPSGPTLPSLTLITPAVVPKRHTLFGFIFWNNCAWPNMCFALLNVAHFERQGVWLSFNIIF